MAVLLFSWVIKWWYEDKHISGRFTLKYIKNQMLSLDNNSRTTFLPLIIFKTQYLELYWFVRCKSSLINHFRLSIPGPKIKKNISTRSKIWQRREQNVEERLILQMFKMFCLVWRYFRLSQKELIFFILV